MTSYIDMSLEDIIQKKKRENVKSKNTAPLGKGKNVMPRPKIPITDARNKIIHKKRTQIVDAREKLAELAKQKDARLKIEQMRLKRLSSQQKPRNMYQHRNKFLRTVQNKERLFIDPSRQVVSQPLATARNISKHLNLHSRRFDEPIPIQAKLSGITRPQPILRTVENDIEVIDDPMGDEYIPPKRTLSSNRKASLQLKIIAHNNDPLEKRTAVYRSAVPEKEKSPPRPPSILKKRPMAALRTDTVEKKTEKPVLEYRIIVSNLRNTVTSGDIEELFGDVGGMAESRLVRPGTAEVIYKTQEDAQRAVDLYHNRQLDGQPMNCLLVTPRANAPPPTRSSSKPALYSTNSNVEPDISTFHKVLFSNL
ncbi:polymerase delta-interacting protein 3-like [Ostrinia nubilalis]|uniref:polymerase delta-interacting protein 3-like n=1 Tax=Ostrinia nubilalis TaxID=29057 RepID=UPI0030823CDC